LIRVDAGQRIGSGHAMRCLALAQAWQDAGGDALHAGVSFPPELTKRFTEERIPSITLEAEQASSTDAARTVELSRKEEVDWLVIDGYQFDGAYQRAVACSDARVLINDDFGYIGEYVGDLILDQNLGAHEDVYARRNPGAELLLGGRYTLLRREFLQIARSGDGGPLGRPRILITLGGADPENVTLKILEAVAGLDAEIIAVVGPANVHGASLEHFVQKTANKIQLLRNPADMPQLMAQADLAVSAAGTTAWELAFMGVPPLLVVLVDNQAESARMLGETGAAKNLGWHHALEPAAIRAEVMRLIDDAPLRSIMGKRGRQIVDGKGAHRVVTKMRSRMFTFRPAREEDCRMIFEWANEEGAREASFSTAPIPWENHEAWFPEKLRDPNCFFYLALNKEQAPIAVVRFDCQDATATISVNVDRQARGRGNGSALILGACAEFFKARPGVEIHAFIKRENPASSRAFSNAGFEECSAPGDPIVRMTLCKP
jgi:UDP-2,4-diacetamido-2,4,6-trideoxy-beta-L-altropyranose hydrolase